MLAQQIGILDKTILLEPIRIISANSSKPIRIIKTNQIIYKS